MENSTAFSNQVVLKVKRSRAQAFGSAAPERLVLVSGNEKKVARNVCVLVEAGVESADVAAHACNIGLKERHKRKLSPDNDVERRDAKMPRIVQVASVDEPFDAEMDAALWTALTDGNFGPVLRLVEHERRNVNTRRSQSPEGATALIAACRRGNLEVVQRLLALGADPEVSDKYGASPMDHAEGFPRIKQALMEASRDAVFDLYVIEPGLLDDVYPPLPTVASNTGALHLNPTTGEFLELVHDTNDSDFGMNEADSDSNEEDYYLNKLDDEDDDGDEQDDAFCDGGDQCPRGEDDDDSRQGLY